MRDAPRPSAKDCVQPPQERPAGAVRGRRDQHRAGRECGHRLVSRPRPGRRTRCSSGRRRDVPGQGDPPLAGHLQAGGRLPQPCAPGAGLGAAPDADRGPARAPLPAANRRPHGRPVAVEGLVRWNHPERGLLEPAEFIEIAQQTGLIKDLTRQRHQHRAAGHEAVAATLGSDLSLSLNIPAHCLLDRSFPIEVERLLRRARRERRALTFEITESSLIVDPKMAKATMRELNAAGSDPSRSTTSARAIRRSPI